MPRLKIVTHLSRARKTLQEARCFLEELVLTAVAFWSLWHVVKVLFFWAF